MNALMEERLVTLQVLQNDPYFSFPVTQSYFFPYSHKQREAGKNNWAENSSDWRGGGKWLVDILYSQTCFNCWGFLRNPGARQHLWSTRVTVLYDPVASVKIQSAAQIALYPTEKKNSILMREVQLPLRNAAFGFFCSRGTKSLKMRTATEAVILFPLVLMEC